MALRWYLLRRFFKYTSPFITPFEKAFVRHYSKKESSWPTIYIIGPPRSGSTVLYQLVTNYFDVLYIDNLAALARNNLYFGIGLSQKKYPNQPHNNFLSIHGKTDNEEPHAPNEGLFWYKYLPKNEHVVEMDALSPKKIRWIKMYHTALKNRYNKPLVIKNLSFGMRLGFIRQIEPDARIILLTRDPADIIHSIYKARKQLNWPEDRLWSIKPGNYQEIEKRPLLEQIVLQYRGIMNEIAAKRPLFGDHFLELSYRELCDDTTGSLQKIQQFVKMTGTRSDVVPPLQFSSGLPPRLNEKIVSLLKRYEIDDK